jgi:hypothetical protein
MTVIFWSYFSVADEIYGQGALDLSEINYKYVQEAKDAARIYGLSWPPYLPEAEEYLLDHRDELI